MSGHRTFPMAVPQFPQRQEQGWEEGTGPIKWGVGWNKCMLWGKGQHLLQVDWGIEVKLCI